MDYKTTIEAAKARLEILAKERDTIDREMQGLMRIIEGAQFIESPAEPPKVPILPEPDADSSGFTESIRLILRRSSVPLVPTEVRDALEMMGVEASSPKVLLIHVHNTLRRLFEKEEIEQVPRDGKMAYRMLTVGDMLFRTFSQHPIVSMMKAIPTTQQKVQAKLIAKGSKDDEKGQK